MPQKLTHYSKMSYDMFNIRYKYLYCQTLQAYTQQKARHRLQVSDWRKYDTEFITPSSVQQKGTLIPVALPHSLTSSQGQSEDQFLVKSPAPPLASAPAGILGSWPLPPPPGRC